ncbi:hypothetical protein CerSpe_183530 [Prunus speciosa]
MSQIVFSYAWWIGTQAENPEEAQLDFPKELTEECVGFKDNTQNMTLKVVQVEDNVSDDGNKDLMRATPVRHAARTAGNDSISFQKSRQTDSKKKDGRPKENEAKAWSPYSPSGLAGLAPFPHYSSPLKRQRRKKMGFGGWRWKEEGIGLLEWISTPTRA